MIKRRQNTGAVTAAGRSAYETKVGVEAVVRSGGRNPQLKGVVHELLYRDSININPRNIARGTKATLSKSATAVRDDVLTMRGGSVVGRAQLKDTVAGIGKTVRQASSGKYAGTRLLGTKETVRAYNKATASLAKNGTGVTKKMASTGVSSKDTSRIAAQTIGGALEGASIAKTALSSGAAGAVISGGYAAVTSGAKLAKGQINGKEFVGTVAKETVGGGLSAAAGSVAATVVGAGAATVVAGTTAPVWVPGALAVGSAVAVGTAAKEGWDRIWD